MSADNVIHAEFGVSRELCRALEEGGFDVQEVGVQMAANVELHERKRDLSGERDAVAYSLGFVEGLLHARSNYRLDAVADTVRSLCEAIAEHRQAIEDAGLVRVDHRDLPAAEAKRVADEYLWSVLERDQ